MTKYKNNMYTLLLRRMLLLVPSVLLLVACSGEHTPANRKGIFYTASVSTDDVGGRAETRSADAELEAVITPIPGAAEGLYLHSFEMPYPTGGEQEGELRTLAPSQEHGQLLLPAKVFFFKATSEAAADYVPYGTPQEIKMKESYNGQPINGYFLADPASGRRSTLQAPNEGYVLAAAVNGSEDPEHVAEMTLTPEEMEQGKLKKFQVTCDGDYKNQKAFMYATYGLDGKNTELDFRFKHSMAYINFVLDGKIARFTSFKVLSITLENVKYKMEGVLDKTGAFTTSVLPDKKTITYEDGNNTKGYAFDQPLLEKEPLYGGTYSENHYIALPPQIIDGQEFELTVRENSTNHGKEYTFRMAFPNTKDGKGWQAGHIYTYKVTPEAMTYKDVIEVKVKSGGRSDSIVWSSASNGGQGTSIEFPRYASSENARFIEVSSYRIKRDSTIVPLPWWVEVTGDLYNSSSRNDLFSSKEDNVLYPEEFVKTVMYKGNGVSEKNRFESKFPGTDEKYVLQMFDGATFSSLESELLRKTPEVGTYEKPYDLSNPGQTWGGTPQETANCYVINGPGWYCIPTIYGNSIYNRQVNPAAWTALRTGAGTEWIYWNGVDAYKNEITHIDVLEQTLEHETAVERRRVEASLLWQDAPGLISNVELVKNKGNGTHTQNYIRFYVSPRAICEGNAVVRLHNYDYSVVHVGKSFVKFTSSDTRQSQNFEVNIDPPRHTLWSWHLWVTGMKATPTGDVTTIQKGVPVTEHSSPMETYVSWNQNVPSNRGRYATLLNKPLGYCNPYQVSWKGAKHHFTFTNGAASVFFDVERQDLPNYTENRGERSVLYQWGRKDPFPGGSGNSETEDKYIYNEEGDYQKYYRLYIKSSAFLFKVIQRRYIIASTLSRYPNVFLAGSEGEKMADVHNAWNFVATCGSINYTGTLNKNLTRDHVVKTMYDPCPPGFNVPEKDAFTGLVPADPSWANFQTNKGVMMQDYLSPNDNGKLFVPALGHRNYGRGGRLDEYGKLAAYWTADGAADSWKGKWSFFFSVSQNQSGTALQSVSDYTSHPWRTQLNTDGDSEAFPFQGNGCGIFPQVSRPDKVTDNSDPRR